MGDIIYRIYLRNNPVNWLVGRGGNGEVVQNGFVSYFLFLRNIFTNFLFLIGACGNIHWFQLNSIVIQNQFVDVAGVTHTTRLNNVKSTNAFFTRIFF